MHAGAMCRKEVETVKRGVASPAARTSRAPRTLLTCVLAVAVMFEGVSSLKDVHLQSPLVVKSGSTVTLRCTYDLENESLYTVKWYKGRTEFFRYTPKELPNTQVFPLNGINVDVHNSNSNQVVLNSAQVPISGRYRCEVSADAPSFQTLVSAGTLRVVGKGVSVFDHYFHEAFPNKTSADVTCDFFHRYKEDLKIAADLKFNVFRFSISWTRLFPRGNISEVNQAGVQFYHDLINEIVAHKMRPLCTIYHFDHPQAYEDEFSGWQSEKMIEKYLEYAKFVLREFGDKVDLWTSINEPNMYCSLVYNGIIPPGMPGQLDSQKVYKCIHNEIIAHAKAFRYYKEEYPKITGRTTGMFGISATSMMARPQTTGFDDIYAAYKTNMFDTSMVLHPVVFGEYPPVVRATLEAQGRGNELPTFTAEEQKIVKGSIDYIGLNAFTGRIVAASAAEGHPSDPLLASLVGPLSDHGAADVSGSSLVTPWILRDITLWIKEIYGVKVFITENGLSTPGKKVDDWNMRAVYHSMYLRELFRTINVDGANVFGYTVWSFLDAYEFANAFESEDGLIYIDHDDPSLQRTPKKSAEYLKNVAEQRYAAPLSASAAHQYDAYTLLTALVTYWLCRVTAPLLS